MDLFGEEGYAFEDKPLIITPDGIQVNNPNIVDRLTEKSISPSMITALEGCHASWLAKTFVLPDILVEEPDNAARRGSAFHQVMENLFALPPYERTKAKLRELTNDVLSVGEFSDLSQYPEALEWMKTIINNYYDMGAKPEKVNVARIVNDYGQEKDGIEVFVKGNFGNTDRDVLGYVDLIIASEKDPNIIIVQDWKTGKVKKWNPKTKDTNGLGEARQQTLYAMLLEKKGYHVRGARLVYPFFKEVVHVDVDSFRDRVLRDVELTEEKLNHSTSVNLFEYSPGVLCAWCPLAKICPSVKIVSKTEKFTFAYDSQPELNVLSEGFRVDL